MESTSTRERGGRGKRSDIIQADKWRTGKQKWKINRDVSLKNDSVRNKSCD